jgi:hypothetical protein
MIKLLFSLINLIFLTRFQFTQCTHFYGGSVTAVPVNWTSTQVTFEFTMNLAWRMDPSHISLCNDTSNTSGFVGSGARFLTCRKRGVVYGTFSGKKVPTRH